MSDADDLLARLTTRLDAQRCPGATTASDTGMAHCAECCYGSGFEAHSQAELDDILLIRDARSALAAERARAERAEALLEQANYAFDECAGDYAQELVADEPWRAEFLALDAPTDTPATEPCPTCRGQGYLHGWWPPSPCPDCSPATADRQDQP